MFTDELKKLKELYEGGLYAPEFYAKRIKDASVFDSYETFCQIPFCYKDELRSSDAYDRTACARDEVYGIFSSSGTTGEKTYYVYSKEDKRVHEEFVKTFYTELGIVPTDLGAVCAPIDTGVMAHTMMWQFTTMGAGYVNCPIPSPENMAQTVSTLPVTVVATRPDVVSAVAGHSECVRKTRASDVRKIILGGGFLSNGRRRLIEDCWDATVYNMYGMSEMFGPMAGECRQRNGQHYLHRYLMIELVDERTGRPVAPGEAGVAVYTTLWNKGFPLLRYWTDDIMRIERSVCACGSDNYRLYHLGRLGDCIQRNGKRVFPVMLEEITMKYGFYMDYQAVSRPDGVTIRLEQPPEAEVSPAMLAELNALFGEVELELLQPRELAYPGHGKRFYTE